MARRFEVVFFDLDGTLLRGTSASQLIADEFGFHDEANRLDRLYRAGRVANADVAQASASHLKGHTLAEVAEILAGGDWITGIEDVIAALTTSSIVPVLATISWDFVGEIVARRYGFESWCGTRMSRSGGVLSGQVGRALESTDKARFVAHFCASRDIALMRAAAVGDSRSDIPAFKLLGYSIALNGDPQAKAAASNSRDTSDLRDLLPELLGDLAAPALHGGQVACIEPLGGQPAAA